MITIETIPAFSNVEVISLSQLVTVPASATDFTLFDVSPNTVNPLWTHLAIGLDNSNYNYVGTDRLYITIFGNEYMLSSRVANITGLLTDREGRLVDSGGTVQKRGFHLYGGSQVYALFDVFLLNRNDSTFDQSIQLILRQPTPFERIRMIVNNSDTVNPRAVTVEIFGIVIPRS